MDRRDMANYLGLTIETVSRTLSWMQKEGMLKVRGKLVQLLDSDALLETAGREHEELLAYGQTTG
jgi:DNA-binding transcriptional regulator YhcF (GntR family)